MYKFKADIEPEAYLAFLKKQPHFHVMQTPMWAEVKESWKSIFCGIYDDEKIIGGGLLLIRHIPVGGKMMYSPRGFVLDYSNKELLKVFTDGIMNYSRKIGTYVVKIDPEIPLSTIYKKEKTLDEVGEKLKANLEELGYIHKGYAVDFQTYTQPRFNAEYYLVNENGESKTDEEILKSYDKKIIRLIGRYQNERGVYFECKSGKEAIDDFVAMSRETEKRQHVLLRDEEYFTRIHEAFGEDNVFLFSRIDLDKYLEFLETLMGTDNEANAIRDKEEAQKLKSEKGSIITMSALNIVKSADTAYLMYAGMDNTIFPRLRANNQLIYEGMRKCRDLGLKAFNFMGIHGDLNDGIAEFKLKFRPHIIEFAGEFDLPIKKAKYKFMTKFFPLAKRIYINIMLKLKRK